ncbi:hypothetical protein [Pengzhenrongella frigida]|uniref:Uncharacterized protein n=1 Tax=Pengzhenrongella frigida TaxID=1259133 RepID=A0A4Q5N0F5_9MICO|nr:hypothetical protein [Cellulomonas sp. HLT2-17]RYV51496.1 hypothetical protein EUA98_07875 [Cellulomonas sp. HLT2-17]
MTDSSGPRRDEPQVPQPPSTTSQDPTRPLPKATTPVPAQPPVAAQTPMPSQAPGASYPPGFEPGAESASAGSDAGAVRQEGVPARPSAKERVARRPVLAGFAGGVLIALLGFGGGFAVGHAVDGDGDGDGGRIAMEGGDRPAFGEGGPGGRLDQDGERGDQDGDQDGDRLSPDGLPTPTDENPDTDT